MPECRAPSPPANSSPDQYSPNRTPDTTFYRIVDAHFEEFRNVYPQRYREDFGYWRPVIADVVAEFLKCGVVEEGFARLRCPDCGEEILAVFSCKQRNFCPSCHQKRSLELAEHLNQNVYEEVPHRQFVFTIPKRFRLYFKYNRFLLGDLARRAWQTIRDVYSFVLGTAPTPGGVVSIQTFGSLMLWNPHIHAVVTDGAFESIDTFRPLGEVPAEPFKQVWEHHVFQLLIERELIKPELADRMRGWDHTGFSTHKDVSIEAGDESGLANLTEYISRCPVAEAKIHQQGAGDKILYDAEGSKPLPFQQWRARPDSKTTKRNFEVFDPLDFLAQVTQHIPNKGQHMIRYYGWYSNRSRGLRVREAREDEDALESPCSGANAKRIRWARLIEKVYAADPLVCPQCGGELKIVEVAENQADIRRILQDVDGYSSGTDPPRGPPDNRPAPAEPFSEDLPWDKN